VGLGGDDKPPSPPAPGGGKVRIELAVATLSAPKLCLLSALLLGVPESESVLWLETLPRRSLGPFPELRLFPRPPLLRFCEELIFRAPQLPNTIFTFSATQKSALSRSHFPQ
jgi:hypothetical protein